MPMIYQGSVHTSVVRVGEIFREPVRQNAAAIIVVHNHPSGDPAPSGEDLRLTRELMQAGTLLDIEVLDHIVIGRGRFLSLREAGLTFS
jgi:DNA repair protein RadC